MNKPYALTRGDRVRMERDGREMEAVVHLASPCGKSLFVVYQGFFANHIGGMPILWKDGAYVDLTTATPINLTPEKYGEN